MSLGEAFTWAFCLSVVIGSIVATVAALWGEIDDNGR